METVENKYITLAYKLYTIENGEKEFTEEAHCRTSVPIHLRFRPDIGVFREPSERFEEQVTSSTLQSQAEEAYGEYDDEHVIDLPKQYFRE